MEFTISSSDFEEALKEAGRATSGTTFMPILEETRIKTVDGGLLLHGTDGNTHVLSTASAQIEEEGEAMLPTSRIKKTLSGLPEMPVSVRVADQVVHLETDHGTYETPGSDPENFPETPEMDGVPAQTPDLLAEAVEKVAFAVSKDSLRPAMMGVYLDSSHDRIVATDGHMLSFVEVPLEGPDAILPSAGAELIARYGTEEEDHELVIGEEAARFEAGGTVLYTKLIDETYPDYESVLPGTDKRLEVPRKELLGAVRRAGIYTPSMTHQIRLTPMEDTLTIEAEDYETRSEATEEVPCHFDGEEMEICFNSEYLKKELSATDSEEITIEMSTPTSAAVLRPDEGHTMVCMPILPSQA